MATPALTPADYFIGKADIGYRAVAATGEYTRLFTIEDTVARLNVGAEVFDPSLDFDLGGAIAGFQYAASLGGVNVETTVPQLDAATLALLIPGATSTTRGTATVGGGLSTTIAAGLPAAVGDTQVNLTAVTNLAVGDYIKIGTGGSIEYRQVLAISSLIAKFFEPLVFAHAAGEAVVETDGDGKTVITPPAPGRISSTAFKEYKIIWTRPDAAPAALVIPRGLVDVGESPIELTTGSRTMGRVRMTIVGYRDPAAPDTAPFRLER